MNTKKINLKEITDSVENLLAFAYELTRFSTWDHKQFNEQCFVTKYYPELAEAIKLLPLPEGLAKFYDTDTESIEPISYDFLSELYIENLLDLDELKQHTTEEQAKQILTDLSNEDSTSLHSLANSLLIDYEREVNQYGRKLIEIINNNI